MRLKRTIIQSKFKYKLKQLSDSSFTAPLVSLHDLFCSFFFSQTTDLYCDFNSFTTQPQHWSLSTNPDQQKIWNPRTFEKSQKKKNGAKSLKRCLWSLLVGGCARDRQLQVWNSVLVTYFWFPVLQNHGCCENWGQMERNGRKLRIFGVCFQNRKFGAQFSQNTEIWIFVRMFVWKFGFLLRRVRIFSVIFRLYEWKFEYLLKLNLCCVCYLYVFFFAIISTREIESLDFFTQIR